MSWNYRVWRSTITENGEERAHYAIYETHYEYGSDAICKRSINECAPSGDTAEDLIGELAKFITAITKPILDDATGAEIEPAARLTDELIKCVEDNPGAFPAMLQRAKGRA